MVSVIERSRSRRDRRNPPGCLLEIALGDDVVAFEDEAGFVPRDEIIMATRSGTPARIMFRTAVRRKSRKRAREGSSAWNSRS